MSQPPGPRHAVIWRIACSCRPASQNSTSRLLTRSNDPGPRASSGSSRMSAAPRAGSAGPAVPGTGCRCRWRRPGLRGPRARPARWPWTRGQRRSPGTASRAAPGHGGGGSRDRRAAPAGPAAHLRLLAAHRRQAVARVAAGNPARCHWVPLRLRAYRIAASERRYRGGGQRAAPEARQREDDVEPREARRRLVWGRGQVSWLRAEQGLAVRRRYSWQ